jgi:hypothetical protein
MSSLLTWRAFFTPPEEDVDEEEDPMSTTSRSV